MTRGLLAKFLSASGVPDGADHGAVHLEQRGRIRLDPSSDWRDMRARQVIDVRRSHFSWRGQIKTWPGRALRVHDVLDERGGRMRVSWQGVLPLVRARGPDVMRGAWLRYVAELPWCPLALRENPSLHVTERVAERVLRISGCRDRPKEHVDLSVELDGVVSKISTPARPYWQDKQFVDRPWWGTFGDYRFVDGYRVPHVGNVHWDLPGESFHAIEVELTSWRTCRAGDP